MICIVELFERSRFLILIELGLFFGMCADVLGKASSNLSLNKNISRKLIFLGSAMFWFSDVMLAIDIFGEGGRITWILCSYTYWLAQNILAFSLFHLINEQLV